MATTVGMKLALEGEAQYKASLQQIQQKSKELASEMKAVVSAGEGEEKQMEVLSKQIKTQQSLIDTLTGKYEKQKSEIENTKKAIEEAKNAYGENSAEVQKLETQLIKQETALSKTKTQINNETDALNKMEKAADTAGQETDELGKEAEEAGRQADKGSEGFTVFKGVVANLATEAIKAAVDGLKNLANGIKEAVAETASYGDEVDKASQKLGVSAETYQQLAYAMDMSGASVEDFKKGMINMNDALADFAAGNESAGDKYAKLGVKMKKADGTLKTSEELLMDTVDALASMEDTTARDAAAQEIFGKKMTELRPLLNSGSKAIKDLMQEAKTYGMVMSDDAVAASANFDDSMTRLQNTAQGLKRSMVSEFLPAISQVADGFSKMVAGVDGGEKDLKAGVQNMISTITSKVPEFLEVGKEIFTSILSGLQQNLPDLIKAVADTIPSIFEAIAGIVEEIDIAGLVTAVFDSLNSIIKAIVPRLPELLMQLVVGIIEALPELFVGVGETIYNIFDGLFGGYNEFDSMKAVLDRQSAAWAEVTKSMEAAKAQIEADVGTWQSHWEMLQNITDENGKIKDGYHEMAQMLVEELNESLGLNIEIIKGQIQDYDTLAGKIDTLIQKKRAEMLLAAEEEAYNEALKMRPQLVEAVSTASEGYEAALASLEKAQNDYDAAAQSSPETLGMMQTALDKAKEDVSNMSSALAQAKSDLASNTAAMSKYMNDYTAVMKGDYSELGETTKQYTGQTRDDLIQYQQDVKQQLEQDQANHDAWLEDYKQTNNAYSQEQAQYYSNRIKTDEQKLDAINELVESKGEEFDAAYVNGILSGEGSVDAAASGVADTAHAGINSAQTDAYNAGWNMSDGFARGIGDAGYLVEAAAYATANAAKKKIEYTLEIASPSKVMRKLGRWIPAGLALGIEDETSLVTDAMGGMANGIAQDFSLGAVSFSHAAEAIGSHGAVNNMTRNNNINVVVNGSEGQSANEIAELVVDKIQMQIIGSEMTYA